MVTLDWSSVLTKRGQITAGKLQHEHRIASTIHTNASDKSVYEGSLLQDTHSSSWQPQPLSSAKTIRGMALGNHLAPDQIWQAWKCCFISLPQKNEQCFFSARVHGLLGNRDHMPEEQDSNEQVDTHRD